jgi:hypothetical protein
MARWFLLTTPRAHRNYNVYLFPVILVLGLLGLNTDKKYREVTRSGKNELDVNLMNFSRPSVAFNVILKLCLHTQSWVFCPHFTHEFNLHQLTRKSQAYAIFIGYHLLCRQCTRQSCSLTTVFFAARKIDELFILLQSS